jgi:hypothetical protein
MNPLNESEGGMELLYLNTYAEHDAARVDVNPPQPEFQPSSRRSITPFSDSDCSMDLVYPDTYTEHNSAAVGVNPLPQPKSQPSSR